MKTMFRFAVAVIGLVVGLNCSATIVVKGPGPDVLPYGKNFPDGVTITSYVMIRASEGWYDTVFYEIVEYTGGGLIPATENALRSMADKFHGTDDGDYILQTSIERRGVGVYGEATKWPVAGWWEHHDVSFKLKDRKIPSEMLSVTEIGYQPYMPALVTGLKSVLLVIRKDGVEVIREESPNGVWDKTCTLYPGNGAYYGPDVLQLKTEYVVPEKREAGVEGEITVYLSDDKSQWSTYNLDGEKIASSEPPVYPDITLTVSPVNVGFNGKIVPEGSTTPTWKKAVLLSVVGAEGRTIVVERTTDFRSWQFANKMLPIGSYTYVEFLVGSIHCYRARVVDW